MPGEIYGAEAGETRFGELAAGEIISIPFGGDATVEYYVIVICDDDGENVDLAVLEADGVEIDVDDADDNAPALNIQASDYRSVLDKPKGIPRPMAIEIRMQACKVETCAYGLRISSKEKAVSKPHCPFALLALTLPAFTFRGVDVRLVQEQEEDGCGQAASSSAARRQPG